MRYNLASGTLIADEPYDVSWTKLDGREFHGYVGADSPYAGQDQFPPGATEEYPWLSRGASIPLSSAVPTTTPLLLADNFRNLLLIQNNSNATAAGDVAPTLYIGIDGPVKVSTFQYAFALAPGIGIVLDTRVLNNAIYAAYGSYTNTGGTVTVGGILTYGRTQNSPPLMPSAVYDPDAWIPAAAG